MLFAGEIVDRFGDWAAFLALAAAACVALAAFALLNPGTFSGDGEAGARVPSARAAVGRPGVPDGVAFARDRGKVRHRHAGQGRAARSGRDREAPMGGRYFEQLEVGEHFVHEVRRTVTDMDNILFCALTYNPAAIHIDHEYAKTTEFGRPLVNSIFTLGLVVGLSVQDTTLGTTVGNLGWEEVVFPKPVFAGDTIRAETTVVAVRASKSRPTQGIVTFEHKGFNQRDEVVCSCRRAALMLKRPA